MAGSRTNAGVIVSISTTSEESNLDQAAFALLTYTDIAGVGNVGELGVEDNIVNYNTYDSDVSDKGKGVANAGDPTLEVRRDTGDAGQDALRTAAAGNLAYAFKIDMNDNQGGSTNSVVYFRALVSGPRLPMGGREDFQLERFILAATGQVPIYVDPT